MASISTASNAASPPSLASAAPHIAIKPTSADKMSTLSTNTVVLVPGIGPTKHWVIPPRPKPGRKPATDTPPTRRKAQNRAAQRAFRERRAARVGELEEQLKETEEERLKRENAMQDQIIQQTDKISRLEQDVQRLKSDVDAWRRRYTESLRDIEHERNEKDVAQLELAYLRNGSRATGTNAVPLPPRRQQPTSHGGLVVLPFDNDPAGEVIGCGECTSTSCACVETAMSVAPPGCGNCTIGGHCQCLDATLESVGVVGLLDTDHKRPHSTRPEPDDTKRPRFSVEQPQQQEIDFTSQFSQAKQPLPGHDSLQDRVATLAPHAAGDSCGFCADGTYCACAEAEGPSNQLDETGDDNRLAPLLYDFTPPPSDSDVTSPDSGGSKIPPLHPNHRIHHSMQLDTDGAATLPGFCNSSSQFSLVAAESCGGDPGSCQQCQEDPRSGLFCRSLAAMRASSGSTKQRPDQCCGALSGGCCRQGEAIPSAKLTCADAYKTLATHKHFDQASDALNEWLPKLEASAPRYPTRAPLDIEAASVMHVIKYFDVRFGRD